jgi:hypothetical protein
MKSPGGSSIITQDMADKTDRVNSPKKNLCITYDNKTNLYFI